jgi:hypothetical protein
MDSQRRRWKNDMADERRGLGSGRGAPSMKIKRVVLSIAPFLIMFAITIGAGRYSSIVSSIEGHGAKGAYGYDVVIFSALAIVAFVVIVGVVFNRYTSRKKESER